jgi:hypothetical protein
VPSHFSRAYIFVDIPPKSLVVPKPNPVPSRLFVAVTIVTKELFHATKRFRDTNTPIPPKFQNHNFHDPFPPSIHQKILAKMLAALPIALIALTAVILLVGLAALLNVALKKPYAVEHP